MLLIAWLAAGCAGVVASPPPTDVRAIVVFPVDNRTGSDLYADAPPVFGLLGGEPGARRLTAADILTEELRRELATRGFEVLSPPAPSAAGGPPPQSRDVAAHQLATAGSAAPGLYVRLWVFDASALSHVVYVDVKLDAILVAPDGRILWEARFPARPVDAGGASSVTLAYPQVARRVAGATLSTLAPAPRTSP